MSFTNHLSAIVRVSPSEHAETYHALMATLPGPMPPVELINYATDHCEVRYPLGYWRNFQYFRDWFDKNIIEAHTLLVFNVERETLEHFLKDCTERLISGEEINQAESFHLLYTVKVLKFCLALPDCYTFEYREDY